MPKGKAAEVQILSLGYGLGLLPNRNNTVMADYDLSWGATKQRGWSGDTGRPISFGRSFCFFAPP